MWPEPGWGSCSGQDHFPETPQLGVGAGMRELLQGLRVLLSFPAGSWPCPDSTSGAALRGFRLSRKMAGVVLGQGRCSGPETPRRHLVRDDKSMPEGPQD